MLHSRGELLLMLDADGATKVNDLEKLENQVCINCGYVDCGYVGIFIKCSVIVKILLQGLKF